MPIPSARQDHPDERSIFDMRESEVQSYARSFPVVFQRASGANLYDVDGNAYIDFLAGCSSLNYGHNHPKLKSALLEYLSSDGLVHSLDMHSEAKEAFLQEFQDKILKPRGFDYVVQFTGPTGANAVEAAIKLARKVTGRTNVISFTNGFHGVTLGALALTGNEHHRGGAGVPLSGSSRIPFDNYMGPDVDTAEYLDQVLLDPSSGVDLPAAVIFESVQGEGGLNEASYEWMRKIAAVTRKHGALLIIDDIQAGIGRTGPFFSFEPAAVKPDIVTLAKSISGYGLPMSLVLIDRQFDEWAPGEHNGTFRGNCPAFVTATAAIKHFWRDSVFQNEVERKGLEVRDRLSGLAEHYKLGAGAVKGRGMMLGLDVGSGRVSSQIVKECFANGLVIETSGPNDEIVKCLAPLTIEDSELGRGLEILSAAVGKAIDLKAKLVVGGRSA